MRPVNIPIPTTSGLLISGRGAITYWAVYDSTASSGSLFRIYDGTGTNGQEILPVSTVAKQSTSEYVHRHHLNYERGLYYSLVSGTIEGSFAVWTDFSNTEWEQYLKSFIQAGGG